MWKILQRDLLFVEDLVVCFRDKKNLKPRDFSQFLKLFVEFLIWVVKDFKEPFGQ